MNSLGIALLLLVSPIAFQLIAGTLSLFKKIAWSLSIISLCSFLAQLICIYGAVQITANHLRDANEKCLMPVAAMFMLGVIALIVLIVVLVTQFLIVRYRRWKIKKSI